MSAVAPGTGRTPFEDMSHEQMLAWLDHANSGTVRLAADRLTAAAEEIRRIGEELKVRPQHVEWKGEGADAFRTWAGDLANSTLRLGDFSDDAAKWLGQASDAIAHVQASIPRDTKSARVNLNSAPLAHDDPYATAAHTKSATELTAIAAAKEKVRQEAALQMLKLGQSYRLSATQLDGLERPAFPPPPTELQPAVDKRDENVVVSAGGAGSRTSAVGGVAGSLPLAAAHPTARLVVDDTGSATGDSRPRESHPHTTVQPPSPEAPDQVAVKVDAAQALPHLSAPLVSPVGPSDGGRIGGPGSGPTGMLPPTMPGSVRNSSSISSGAGRAATGGRAIAQPVRRSAGPGSQSRSVPGTAAESGQAGTARPVTGGRPAGLPGRETVQPTTGRASGSNGVIGGRPASPAAGSSAGGRAGGLPRGIVVGGKAGGGKTGGGDTGGTAGRGPAGQSPSTGRSPGTGGAGVGQRSTPAGRRGTGDGVVGGRPQPQVRSGARPFTAGGLGLVRNQDSGGAASAPGPARRTDAWLSGSRSPNVQRSGEQDGRNGGQGKKTGDRSEEAEPEQPTGHSNT